MGTDTTGAIATEAFTDEVLSPDRCTRSEGGAPHYDSARDRGTLILGDELLVDTGAYGVDGSHWCTVVGLAAGSASVYPYKVKIPGRGTGQYKAREILAWRRPLWLHEALNVFAARAKEGGR